MKKLIIIVGPTRTGTTSAWTILKNLNLDILCLSKIKENYYFHDNHDLSNYLTNFKNPSEFAIDFAPSLFHRDQALENLNRLNVSKSIYVILRRPSELYLSSYKYNLQNNKISCTYSEYMTDNVFSRFSYEKRLPRLRELLPNSEINFIIFDEFKLNLPGTLHEIVLQEFKINLQQLKLENNVKLNQSGVDYKYKSAIKTMIKISNFFPKTKAFIKSNTDWPAMRGKYFEKIMSDKLILNLSDVQKLKMNNEDEYYYKLLHSHQNKR